MDRPTISCLGYGQIREIDGQLTQYNTERNENSPYGNKRIDPEVAQDNALGMIRDTEVVVQMNQQLP